MQTLSLHLDRQWFEKIRSREKNHVYIPFKDPRRVQIQSYFDLSNEEIENMLHGQTCIRFFPIDFNCDYSICFLTDSISIKNGLNTDLRIDELVFDIEFS